MSKRDLSREWDFDLPRNNLFEDWPLDKKVSISPELEQQIAGNPKSQKENDIAKPSSKYRRTPMPKTKQGEHAPTFPNRIELIRHVRSAHAERFSEIGGLKEAKGLVEDWGYSNVCFLCSPRELSQEERLQIAAPDLLAACEAAARLITRIEEWADAEQEESYSIMDSIVDAAQGETGRLLQQAIRQAKGES